MMRELSAIGSDSSYARAPRNRATARGRPPERAGTLSDSPMGSPDLRTAGTRPDNFGLAVAALGSLLLTCSAMRAHHSRRIRELESEIVRLSHVADRDALTGLGNRRCFDRCLALEWRRAMRHGSHLTLALIDADDFKSFNDSYGHPAGDAALVTVARSIAGALGRAADTAFRIGGEEFALILPDADRAGASRMGQRICDAVRAASVPHAGTAAGVLTVSFGSCSAIVREGHEATDLLSAADRALYEAKAGGRNQAVCDLRAMPPPPTSTEVPVKMADLGGAKRIRDVRAAEARDPPLLALS